MPLSKDERTNELAGTMIKQISSIFGKHQGYRPTHAKGLLTTGTFTPIDEARTLSKAPHFQAATAIAIRYSDTTGIHQIPDTDANASPRGMAVRFFLDGSERKHTDIVAHSTPFFAASTGAEFLAFLQALSGGTIQEYLESHPAALAFVQAPKPTPKSFATAAYYGVNAMIATNSDGVENYLRYRIIPEAGVQSYEDNQLGDKTPDFLFDELRDRLDVGPANFALMAHIADDCDIKNDATIQWPENRKQVKLGTISVEKLVDDSLELQRTIIMDPVPRVEGLGPSDDPLLDFRASAYLQSGRERRDASGYEPEKLAKLI